MIEYLTHTIEIPLWASMANAVLAAIMALVVDRFFWRLHRRQRMASTSGLEIEVTVNAKQAEAEIERLAGKLERFAARMEACGISPASVPALDEFLDP